LHQPANNILSEIDKVFISQVNNVNYLRNTGVEDRIKRLEKIEQWIESNQEKIRAAIHKDFGKPYPEIDLTEIFNTLAEIRLTKSKLSKWMKPVKVARTLTMLTTGGYVQYVSKGVVLIISPWNYPFLLAIEPLISAIAAGNAVIVKPSEISFNTSALINEMLSELFPGNEVKVFEGDKEIASYLLTKPFDHIFFTGSTAVGKIVLKAAAEHFTSVTLELGGKSPVIIDSSADLKDAAQKLAWGKFLNSGQTCQSPDYLLLEEKIKDEFIGLLISYIKKYFGNSPDEIKSSSDFARIVNYNHIDRLINYFEEAKKLGANIEFGGIYDKSTNYFSPTILTGDFTKTRLMEEEIFGPILPVLTFVNTSEVLEIINSKTPPLAIYIFSMNKETIDKIKLNTVSGGVVINDLVLQFSHYNLPFGGIKESGVGTAHGFYGFETFSNRRAILKHHKFSPLKLFYPPYTKNKQKLINLLIKYFK